MILTVLLLLGGVDEGQGAGDEPVRQKGRATAWWAALSEEDRGHFVKRHAEFSKLSSEARRELRRRASVLGELGRAELDNLSPDERAVWEKSSRKDRTHRLHERMRGRLAHRAGKLGEALPPGFEKELRGAPLEHRVRRSREMVREFRRGQMESHLLRAVSEGWIGEKAAEYLKTASTTEVLAALGQVEKWRICRKARERGLWKKWGLDAEQSATLEALSPPEFFRGLERVRPDRGDIPRPHGRHRPPPHQGR